MRGIDFGLDPLSWRAPAYRRCINRKHITLVNNRRVIAELLGGAIVIEKAVALPFNIMQLGKDIGGYAFMQTQLIGKKLETPAHIAIPVQRPYATILAVNEWLCSLSKTRHVIEG